jgi:hypothetical protein
MHPTYQPPARLQDRPFILTAHEEPRISQDEDDEWRILIEEQTHLAEGKPLPPVESPTPMNHTGHERDEATDYFTLQMAQQRPPIHRSHWSESTIRTIDTTPIPQEREIRQTTYQNFSHKRNTVPKRPPAKAADSIDNFIKRGGWKRRGIVFQRDPEGRASQESLF